MAVADQCITDRFAVYNGDACEVLPSLKSESVHLSLFSPPFPNATGGLYHYSSDEADLSNSRSYAEWFEHFAFIVRELYRVMIPGRMVCVHCMDVPTGNTGTGSDHLIDFPGDLIRCFAKHDFLWVARYAIWKEPLEVRNRTLTKSLAHKTIVDDSSRCSNAAADYLLAFRKKGINPLPIAHPHGLTEYAGAREIPRELLRYRNWAGKQIENRYSHWIWRQYASAFWDDIRLDRVLPYREARDPEDEKHVHALQQDVIERCGVLWSNLGETILTPFMGVGSEVYGALTLGRRGIGIELKPSYYRQALANLQLADAPKQEQATLFDLVNDHANGNGHNAAADLEALL